MTSIPITDPDDARVAPYRAVRERDVVGRGERFVAEGEVVLRLLIEGGRGAPSAHAPESLLIAENRLDALGDLLTKLPPEIPVYAAGQVVMDAVVGFHIHRGVLAIARRAQPETAAELLARLPAKALVVALVGVANHDNVGGIFRNAAAFGADAVLLDETSCDPLYRKAIRVSVGASLVLPFARGGSGHALLDALAAGGFRTLALSPAGTHDIAAVPPAPRTALLLGAEGPGLPADLMARTTTARVPMATGFDSLNVATTSGIALYELTCATP
ncbi:tRNA G18 (ribose-2'-O)-methylase SpoU [Methylopila capsulata]|uniref:RNA methyltransferase n=1 Tax=Methylopila capsulata TaxID=61654 RepID=A0A9W6IWT6_9HYPH|nr:RNA methyltransferase [Methylopila capsulata]MBM7852515.1 tRNA G18 (ribose-2'-O)-methylase SpoU [Methylopila capsulata]GLK56724.1 RNA methyltransferase [Methylopila capsulata]